MEPGAGSPPSRGALEAALSHPLHSCRSAAGLHLQVPLMHPYLALTAWPRPPLASLPLALS